MALTAPQEAAVVMTAKSELRGDAEAGLLAFHVSTGRIRAGNLGRLAGSGGGQERIAVLLGDGCDRHAHREQNRHHRQDRPALLRVPDHLAEGVGQPGRDQEDQDHLQEVGEGGRVLERVGGVGIEESAAVGPELLDGLLRSNRSLRDRLRPHRRAWSPR